MFTISNLSVSYGRKSVLRDLSLEIPEQSITGIAGYNGAGKTTLLNAMYGLFRCAKDCLKHNGTPVTMKEIAFLEAETYFYSGITGRDWLSFFMRKNRKFDYEKWSSLFSLPLDEAVADYSLGMKKKLALLAVLSLDRKFIILDEPFNSLDLESVTMLEIILKRLAEKGSTIIVTSHMIEVLMSCCDSICILRDGSITGRYPKEQFGSLSDSIREEVSARCGGILDFQFLISSVLAVGAGLRSEYGAWLRLLCTWIKAPDGLPAFVRREARRLAGSTGMGRWVVCMRRKNGESDISLENIR